MGWPVRQPFQWPVIEVRSWDHFEDVVREMANEHRDLAGNPARSFRGQSNAAWPLKPSIARLFGKVSDDFAPRALEIEREILDRYVTSRFGKEIEVPVPGGILKLWGEMQHYRVPTRLLDWTYSPYVAAYFAIGRCEEHGKEQPGAVFSISNAIVGDMAQANYAFRPGVPLDQVPPPDLFQADPAAHRYFAMCLDPPSNERMFAQQGHFSYSTFILDDHEQAIQGVTLDSLSDHKHGTKYLAKIVIPPELKLKFLGQLHEKGFSGERLFRKPDGLGLMLEEIVRLRLADTLNPSVSIPRQLPLRALVAYAARYARRVRPLFRLSENHISKLSHYEVVDSALRLAESFAAGISCHDEISGEKILEALEASTSGGLSALAAFFAAKAAIEAGANNSAEVVNNAARAVEHARVAVGARGRPDDGNWLPDAAAIAVAVAAAGADFEKLSRMGPGVFPELGQPVDTTESGPLGPLWPEGEPNFVFATVLRRNTVPATGEK